MTARVSGMELVVDTSALIAVLTGEPTRDRLIARSCWRRARCIGKPATRSPPCSSGGG
jgi:hypothetical protein